VDELIRKLQERRAALLKIMSDSLAKSGESLAAGKPKEDRAADDAAYEAAKKDVAEIDVQLERRKEQLAAEQRAADLAAATGDTGGEQEGRAGGTGVQVTSEPTMYGRYSGRSFFLDMARANPALGNDPEARARLDRHRQELDVELPKRRAARAKRATAQLEQRMTRSVREERAYDRFLGQGGKPFHGGQESRALSRTDGQGGFFVPPLWLVDDYIPYLRAGRTFADLWMNLPLPAGTDSINIPRVVLGTATGPQPSDGAPLPGRDIKDNFVNALVRTVAGQQDAALQLLDQSPVAYDQIIFKDLMADYAMNLSGQLMLGSGTNGQLTGLYPAGLLGTSSGASAAGRVINNAATVWTSASAANFYQSIAQVISGISRTRFRRPTAVVTNDAVWFGMASSTDSQGRPLVVATASGLGYNQAAADDPGQTVEGPVGHIYGVPWSADPNIPLTFGGTNVPYIGAISQGNVAPIDGSGGNPDYTPAIAMVADDLFLWEGELRTRTLSEVLSGDLQIRFQVYGYAASMPNRYQDASGNLLSYGNYNTVGTTGGILSTAGGLANF
jgi:HK97 family phage major capsid protein